MPQETNVTYQYNDYAQSANALFHFVTKPSYLKAILRRKALIPRYCIEDINYLKIELGGKRFDRIAVLQKCFCDIPFHKLMNTFEVHGFGEVFDSLDISDKAELERHNSHPDFYGKYAIAFSKKWGEQNDLQPVQYVNQESCYANGLSDTILELLQTDDLPDKYADDILRRLSLIKPLRGVMRRQFTTVNGKRVDVQINKNFHDEHEWRYVPSSDILESLRLSGVIANQFSVASINGDGGINRSLESTKYKTIWMPFTYDDIRYIIVPDVNSRIAIIDDIASIPDDYFVNQENAQLERYVLVSKILVLDDIRKDW